MNGPDRARAIPEGGFPGKGTEVPSRKTRPPEGCVPTILHEGPVPGSVRKAILLQRFPGQGPQQGRSRHLGPEVAKPSGTTICGTLWARLSEAKDINYNRNPDPG
jgi:hypothetical protein